MIVTKYICTPHWQEPEIVAIQFEDVEDGTGLRAIEGQKKKARRLLRGWSVVPKHDARLHDTREAAVKAAVFAIRKQIEPLIRRIEALTGVERGNDRLRTT
jgi:hypothetical protein